MNLFRMLFRGDSIETPPVVDPAIAATERLITQLQEDLIHERFVIATLLERLKQSSEPTGEVIDMNTLEPMQRRSQPLSMMKARAAQILLEKRKEKVNAAVSS